MWTHIFHPLWFYLRFSLQCCLWVMRVVCKSVVDISSYGTHTFFLKVLCQRANILELNRTNHWATKFIDVSYCNLMTSVLDVFLTFRLFIISLYFFFLQCVTVYAVFMGLLYCDWTWNSATWLYASRLHAFTVKFYLRTVQYTFAIRGLYRLHSTVYASGNGGRGKGATGACRLYLTTKSAYTWGIAE